MYIDEIADINVGIVLSRKETNIRNDNIFKYKCFSNKSYYDDELEYDDFYCEEDLSDILTKENDLIMKLTLPLQVIKVDEKTKDLIIPNQFCLIRIKESMKSKYDLNYIKTYLESNYAKKMYEKDVTGTAMKVLTLKGIKNIDVPLIDINKQKQLGKIEELWMKQKKELEKLISLKDNLYKNIIENKMEEK